MLPLQAARKRKASVVPNGPPIGVFARASALTRGPIQTVHRLSRARKREA